MNNQTKAAGIGSVIVFFLGALAVVAALIATAYIVSQPTTGLDLAQRAAAAKIEQQQADTARTLAEASKLEAEARAQDRASTVDTFNKLLNITFAGGVCLGALLFLGVLGLAISGMVQDSYKTYSAH